MVERYDRTGPAKELDTSAISTPVYRVHQEDFCQALRVHPSHKYQNEGGPGPLEIVGLLRAHAVFAAGSKLRDDAKHTEDDVSAFLGALILNWLIGGTDAHAKNYSLIIGGGGLVRLAPLYDIASVFAYRDVDPRRAKLAMKIGDEYRLDSIGLPQWRKFAAMVRYDLDALVQRIRAMAAELPDRLSDEVNRMRRSGLSHDIIDRLATSLPDRARRAAAL